MTGLYASTVSNFICCFIDSSSSLNGSPIFLQKTPTSTDKTGVFTWPNQPTENVQQVYRKVQRCHSEKNNYDEVRRVDLSGRLIGNLIFFVFFSLAGLEIDQRKLRFHAR